jgi:Sec7 domain
MDNFDLSGLRLDVAFRYADPNLVPRVPRADATCRRLCEKLYLKAETQQVDRILEQFSLRYWKNNPDTVYGSAGESGLALSSAAPSNLKGLQMSSML